MFDYLDNAVIKLCDMSTVGTDLGTVKQQIEELKVGKSLIFHRCWANQSFINMLRALYLLLLVVILVVKSRKVHDNFVVGRLHCKICCKNECSDS